MCRFFLFIHFGKRGAWLGDAQIIVLYWFLQCLLSVDLFTKSNKILIASSEWQVFFGMAVGTSCSSILGAKVVQKWIKNLQKCDPQGFQIAVEKHALKKCKNVLNKIYPKMRSQKVIFLMFFKGLGPGVPQGGPRDPPPGRQKWAQRCQNGAPSHQKKTKRSIKKFGKWFWKLLG